MKKIVLRKNKEGVMTTLQPQLMVKRFAKISADTVLDICYTWIAEEQGLLKKGFIKRTEKQGYDVR